MNKAALILFVLSMVCFAYGQYETARDMDSWDLGKPDNLVKTEVIIMGSSSCDCPE